MNPFPTLYGKFEPLPPTEDEKNKHHEIHEERQRRIKQYVEDNNLTKLECDYFGMDSYYYDNKTQKLYKVCNIGGSNPKFVLDNDPHILELNRLPIIYGYEREKSWLNINTRLNQEEY